MAKATFSLPKSMAEECAKIGLTVPTREVELTLENGAFKLDGYDLTPESILHATSLGIRQKLANAGVSATSLKRKDKDGKPTAEIMSIGGRVEAWEKMFDDVLTKLTRTDYLPSWETQFSGAGERESVDPVTRELHNIVAALLRKSAKDKGQTLPKMNTEEYRTLRDELIAGPKGPKLRALAQNRVDELEALGDIDPSDDESEDQEDAA